MGFLKRFIQSLGLAAALSSCQFDLDSLRARDAQASSNNREDGGSSLRRDIGIDESRSVLPRSEFNPDSDCVMLYHFNLPNYTEQSCCGGDTLEDHGTTSVESDDGFREARFFDGNNTYLASSRNATLSLTDKITIDLLVKPLKSSNSFEGGFGNLVWQIDSCNRGDKSYCGFGVQIYADNHIGATLGLGEGTFHSLEGSTRLAPEAWNQVRFTYDGTAMRIKINGNNDGELPVTGTIARTGIASLYIGSDNGQYNNFKGSIDEVRISKSARIDEDILTPPNCGSLDGGADEGADEETPSCYANDFSASGSLDDLTLENGLWSRHPEGYLRQTEKFYRSWRKAYVTGHTFSDIDTSVRIRSTESTNSSAGVHDDHRGILLRYDPESGTGYVAQLQHGDGDTIQVSLDDFLTGDNLQNVTIDCGEIACSRNTWYTLGVTMRGSDLRVSLDGVERLAVTDSRYERGRIGFACYALGESHYDDFSVCPIE